MENVSIPEPEAVLADYLTADFRSDEKRAAQEAAKDNPHSLSAFLAFVSVSEDIDRRSKSEECDNLRARMSRLLEPAVSTRSFRAFIVDEVARAYAWELQVSAEIAPDRLELSSGGMTDPVQAAQVEAQVLRGHLFDVIHRHVSTTDTPSGRKTGYIRPAEYSAAMRFITRWRRDYGRTYGVDPFEGIDMDAYQDAAVQAVYVDPESEEGKSLAAILRKAIELQRGEKRRHRRRRS